MISLDLPGSSALPHAAAFIALVASVMVGVPTAQLTAPVAIRERLARSSDDLALAATLFLAAGLLRDLTVLAQSTLGLASGREWLAIPSQALFVLTMALAAFALFRGGNARLARLPGRDPGAGHRLAQSGVERSGG